ncbi:MAG TPA: RnfH family protein [Rubrivivax sp.]
MIHVEVVYCPRPGAIDSVELSLQEGCTLRDALAGSGLLLRHGLSLETVTVGVWGRKQGLDAALRSRDRVEIYRPLQCDPKEARRLRYGERAAAGKRRPA